MVTIDMDPTDDPVHNSQQLSMFNGHNGVHCYLPLLGLVSFNDEPDQYLVAAMLRPGNTPAKRGAIVLLKRLIPELRMAFLLPGSGFVSMAVLLPRSCLTSLKISRWNTLCP